MAKEDEAADKIEERDRWAQENAKQPPMTPEMAETILKVAQQENLRQAQQEMAALLKRHKLALQPEPYIDGDGRIRARVALVSQRGEGA